MQITKKINVSVSQSLSIPSCVNYDRTINEVNFPPDGRSGVVEIVIVSVGYDAYTESVHHNLRSAGLRPATIRELVALAVENRDVFPDPVAALGSVYMAYRRYTHGGISSGLEWSS